MDNTDNVTTIDSKVLHLLKLYDALKNPISDSSSNKTIVDEMTSITIPTSVNQENLNDVDFNSWINMVIGYSNKSWTEVSYSYGHMKKDNIHHIITPESEYMFLFRAEGIDSIIWLPNSKNKLKGKNSKIKLDKMNRLIIVEVKSKSSGIKCISFEINDIISINVGSNNNAILQEIDDADKHLWMNIRNKPELNITFINARTRNLFEKVLIKVWTEL